MSAGLLQGRLQLLQPLVQIVLPLRELFEAIENLAVFALFRSFLLVLGLPLGLIAIFVILQLKLLHLLPLLL